MRCIDNLRCHQLVIKDWLDRAMRVLCAFLLSIALPVSAETRIGLGSCFNQARDAAIWSPIANEKLDGFLFLGDNLYASRGFSIERLKRAYGELDQLVPFDSLGFVHAIWDDHDYGENDGGQYFVHKDYSGQLFKEFFAQRSDLKWPAKRGTYHASIRMLSGHKVQFIGLDTRSFRSPLTKTPTRNQPGAERYVPSVDADQSMLGEAQWQWLEKQLQASADLRIVMSSIQVLAEGHGWERWGNLPNEQARLLKAITARAGGRVLFVSGDRHVGGAYQTSVGGETLYEITSSGLNMAWTEATEYLPNQVGDPIRVDHYAVLNLDTEGLVSVQWKDKTGTLLSEFPLR